MTVAEQTLARLDRRRRELRSELEVETDRRWRLALHSQIRDIEHRIDQVLAWADTPMGRQEVV